MMRGESKILTIDGAIGCQVVNRLNRFVVEVQLRGDKRHYL